MGFLDKVKAFFKRLKEIINILQEQLHVSTVATCMVGLITGPEKWTPLMILE